MPNTLDGFRTQNLYQASYLVACGFRIVGKERSGQKVTVIFEPHPDIAAAAVSFHNGGVQVEPKALFAAYRDLKDFVFER